VHDQIGRGDFMAIFIASGVVASAASLVRLVLTKNLTYTMLGASGAVTGIIGTWLWLEPEEE
jgi:rhomboid-like protein